MTPIAPLIYDRKTNELRKVGDRVEMLEHKTGKKLYGTIVELRADEVVLQMDRPYEHPKP